jgi:hypothetical protein
MTEVIMSLTFEIRAETQCAIYWDTQNSIVHIFVSVVQFSQHKVMISLHNNNRLFCLTRGVIRIRWTSGIEDPTQEILKEKHLFTKS